MSDMRITGPVAVFAEWIVKGNERALVIQSSDRPLAVIPLGYAVVAGIALSLAPPPLVIGVALLALYVSGGSLAVEETACTVPAQAVAAPAWQPERRHRIAERAGR